jgi:hypothetical protein
MTRFIVMTAAANMPSSCKGTYRRVAVVETNLPEGEKPKFIGDRAKGLVRIVETWERLNCGTSPRCAYAKALVEAEAMAAEMQQNKDEYEKRLNADLNRHSIMRKEHNGL